MVKKKIFAGACPAVLIPFIIFLAGTGIFGQDLSLGPDDFAFEQRAEEGFHLFIRKKPDISSVLLTESTRDPAMGADNYAYRSLEWNPINGDELRLLDGVPIPRESRIYSLISSSTELHPELGEAFHIFVPPLVYYGYEGGRHGQVSMIDGAYINVRAFNLPYGDYRGRFADNPFVLLGVQRPVQTPREGDNTSLPDNASLMDTKEAEDTFMEIAEAVNGDFTYAESPSDLIEKIEEILIKEAGRNVDIVICIDTTGSMGRYIDAVRRMLIPMIQKTVAAFSDWRIGMVLYRDYPPDVYLTRLIPFTKDFLLFQRNLNAIIAWGGGDIPEAVYEALYDGADKFSWTAESRQLILIGDAPPHPEQRGEIHKDMAFQKIIGNGLKVNAILLSQ